MKYGHANYSQNIAQARNKIMNKFVHSSAFYKFNFFNS